MKNKLIILSLVFILAVGVLAGCTTKDPKELLKDATVNQNDIEVSNQSLELGIKLDAQIDDPMASSIIQAINNSRIKLDISADTENKKFSGNALIELKGFGATYNVEFYGNEDIVIVKVPMLPQYLYFEINEETKALLNGSNDTEQIKADMKKLTIDMIDMMLNQINDENITMEKKVSFETKSGNEKFTKVEIKFEDEELKNFIKNVFNLYLENEAMMNIMKDQLKTQGQITTDEEFETFINDMKSNFNEGFDEIDEIIKFNTLNQNYYINKDEYIIGQEFSFGFSVKSDEENIDVTIELEGKHELSDINEDIEIVIPEINKDESINILDLMEQQMYNY